MDEAQQNSPFEGGAPTKEGRGMLVGLTKRVPVSRTNIPLRHFAFATRRCPPSKGEVGLAKPIGAGVILSPHRRYIPLCRYPFSKGQGLISAQSPIILSKIISSHPIDNPFRACLIEYRFIA